MDEHTHEHGLNYMSMVGGEAREQYLMMLSLLLLSVKFRLHSLEMMSLLSVDMSQALSISLSIFTFLAHSHQFRLRIFSLCWPFNFDWTIFSRCLSQEKYLESTEILTYVKMIFFVNKFCKAMHTYRRRSLNEHVCGGASIEFKSTAIACHDVAVLKNQIQLFLAASWRYFSSTS